MEIAGKKKRKILERDAKNVGSGAFFKGFGIFHRFYEEVRVFLVSVCPSMDLGMGQENACTLLKSRLAFEVSTETTICPSLERK